MNKNKTKTNHELSPALIVLMSIATVWRSPATITPSHCSTPSRVTFPFRQFGGLYCYRRAVGLCRGLLFLVPLGDMFERRRLIV